MDLLIALHLIGRNKLSAYKVTSEPMVDFYRKVLEIGGYESTNEKICSSRTTMMKTVSETANVFRNNIRHDVKGLKVCVIHDDGTTKEGMNECYRAISITFIKNNRFQRRFLNIEKADSKTGISIAASISKTMESYGITNYYIASDGASSNNVAARQLGLENNICQTHTIHLIGQRGFSKAELQIVGFKTVMITLKKILNKSSRKHVNSKLCDVEGYIKIPSLVDTRWLSLFNCFQALLKNHDIIMSNRSIFGFSETEFDIFSQKDLLTDIRDILQFLKTALLKLETQCKPTVHLVLPVYHTFFVECVKFSCNIEKTNIGRQLAYLIKEQINTYVFGTNSIAQRHSLHHIIQTGLDVDSNLFNKYNRNYEFDFDGLCPSGIVPKQNLKNEILQNLQTFRTQLFPSLKQVYKNMNLHQASDALNSDSSEEEIDLDKVSDMSNSTRSSLTELLKEQKLKRQDSKVFKDLKYEYQKFKAFLSAFKSDDNNNDGRFTTIIEKYKMIQDNKHFVFWNLTEVKMCFPILQKIVMDSLIIPASNAMVESLFSHLSDIKTFRRSSLSEKSLNDLLVLFYADLYVENSPTNYFKSELSS